MTAEKNKKDDEVIVIKKYPNRRLYNTETSVYVTLEDLAQLVRDERDFVVVDAKSGEDLTRQVLTQIILELENGGATPLPIEFLRNAIRFYDNNMSHPYQQYLNVSMKTFVDNQEKIREYATKSIKDFTPFGQLEEMTRQNMAMFEKAFSMFTPFSPQPDEKKKK